jgi:hypothetical protein
MGTQGGQFHSLSRVTRSTATGLLTLSLQTAEGWALGKTSPGLGLVFQAPTACREGGTEWTTHGAGGEGRLGKQSVLLSTQLTAHHSCPWTVSTTGVGYWPTTRRPCCFPQLKEPWAGSQDCGWGIWRGYLGSPASTPH